MLRKSHSNHSYISWDGSQHFSLAHPPSTWRSHQAFCLDYFFRIQSWSLCCSHSDIIFVMSSTVIRHSFWKESPASITSVIPDFLPTFLNILTPFHALFPLTWPTLAQMAKRFLSITTMPGFYLCCKLSNQDQLSAPR